MGEEKKKCAEKSFTGLGGIREPSVKKKRKEVRREDRVAQGGKKGKGKKSSFQEKAGKTFPEHRGKKLKRCAWGSQKKKTDVGKNRFVKEENNASIMGGGKIQIESGAKVVKRDCLKKKKKGGGTEKRKISLNRGYSVGAKKKKEEKNNNKRNRL